MTKKSFLILSLSANFVFLLVILFFYNSLKATAQDRNYIGEIRQSDLQKLEVLSAGRVSKQDAIYLLRKNFPKDIFFDIRKKDQGTSVNAIDAGSITLVFDNKDKLIDIEPHLFEGP